MVKPALTQIPDNTVVVLQDFLSVLVMDARLVRLRVSPTGFCK